MPRRFITEVDIEELFRQGERTLAVTSDMTLTDLAYERARQRGIKLIDGQIPSAPVRPYLVNRPGGAGAQKTEPAQGKNAQLCSGCENAVGLERQRFEAG
jgi:hypothetical protein